MDNLPEQYKWLSKEPGPKMLMEAIKLYGIKEVIGSIHNPVILSWAEQLGLKQYKADEIPWCGLFVAYLALMAGKIPVKDPLWAQNWGNWGKPSEPELGAVLVFVRNGGGHVGLYVGEDLECYHVLGGNQGNAVSITRIIKKRCTAIRALYKVGKPENVRRIWLTASGEVSTNEA